MFDAAWLAATAACVAAVAGCTVAASGLRTLKQTRFDSRERGRPILAAKLERIPYVGGSQKLIVGNYGTGIARDIWVTFDPLLPDPDPSTASESVTPFLKRRYGQQIRVMVPGQELENIYFSGRAGVDGHWENFEPLPDRVVVRIVYFGPGGKKYRDIFPIDTNLLRQTTEATSSTSPDARLKEAVKSLHKMDIALGAIARSANSVAGGGPSRQSNPPSMHEVMRQLGISEELAASEPGAEEEVSPAAGTEGLARPREER